MRKISLFIAMSLDGYIADHEGRVDWLGGQGEEEGKDQGQGGGGFFHGENSFAVVFGRLLQR